MNFFFTKGANIKFFYTFGFPQSVSGSNIQLSEAYCFYAKSTNSEEHVLHSSRYNKVSEC
jgi:hypothetical protein